MLVIVGLIIAGLAVAALLTAGLTAVVLVRRREAIRRSSERIRRR
jgi:hypothetical protein